MKRILSIMLALMLVLSMTGAIAEGDHVHDHVITSNGNGTHTLSCECGHSYDPMKCGDYDGDGKCDSCGYVVYPKPEEHKHDYVTRSNNDGTHTVRCDDCGDSYAPSKCGDSNGDNKCDSCGFVMYTPKPEVHEHDYVAHSNNDGKHTLSCNCGLSVTTNCNDGNGDNKCDSCGYVMYTPEPEVHEHDYVAHSNNDGKHTLSCSCGLSVTTNCNDANGDNKCDSCSYVMYAPEPEVHEHNYVAHSNDNGKHTLSCTCGSSVDTNCNDANGDNKCDSCGYVMYAPEPEVHEHNYVAHSNNDGKHTLSCNCGLSVIMTCLDSDGDGKCDSCGYQKYVAPEEEHEHNYITHSNSNGKHTLSCDCGLSVIMTCFDGDGDGKCDSCGYQKYVAPEAEEEHKQNYVSQSSKKRAYNLVYNEALSAFGPKVNEIGGIKGSERVAVLDVTQDATTMIDVIAFDYAVAKLEVVVGEGKLTAKVIPNTSSILLKDVEIVVYTSIDAYNAGEGVVLTKEGLDLADASIVIIAVNGTANFEPTDEGVERVSFDDDALEAMIALVK